ncbi:MAG: hypothetical protein Q8P69_00775 [bacterium]|nr:hypothetical protein [bacterium]
MNSPEQPRSNKESVDMQKVITIRNTMTGAFGVLKEHSAGLSDGELRILARAFTGEAEEYFQDFFLKLKKVKSESK